WQNRDQPAQRDRTAGDAERAAGGGECQAFDEDLAAQSPRRRAECAPNRELTRPAHGLHELKVADVHRGERHQQDYGAKQHEERLPYPTDYTLVKIDDCRSRFTVAPARELFTT